MNPVEIRRLIIKSLFADDELLARLVLKGGNALNLVHNIGNRSSLDIDCSMEGEFKDVREAQQRILGTLKKRFEVEGLSIFDTQFEEISGKASTEGSNRWGGYNLKFKVIPQRRFDELHGDVRKAQIQALVTVARLKKETS
jgi:Nucleotidyl transferase AbiEii toxin, Type IV TA system